MPKSTEPANAHCHFTTHMPIAYEWQHPRSPVHDPPSREIDQGAEETMNEATPQPLGTRKRTHPKGHDRLTLRGFPLHKQRQHSTTPGDRCPIQGLGPGVFGQRRATCIGFGQSNQTTARGPPVKASKQLILRAVDPTGYDESPSPVAPNQKPFGRDH